MRCPLCASEAVKRCGCGAVIVRDERGVAIRARRNGRVVFMARPNSATDWEASFTGPRRAALHATAMRYHDTMHVDDYLPPGTGGTQTKGEAA